MPFCPKCGEEITPGATFCYYCGELLPKKQTPQETKSIPTSQPVTTSQPVPAPPPKPMPKELPLPTSHRTRNIVIAIALIVIAVPVGIVAYSFATGFVAVSTTNQTQQQGAMAIPIYQIIQNNPDGVIFNVTNTGTKNLTIATAYIDGIQVATMLGNLTLPIGNTNTLGVVPQTSQNIVDGAAHTLKIVASDGTVVTISVVYNTPPPQGALSVDSGSITTSGITVYVRNTGTKTETLTSAYVDNVLIASGSVSFTPSATIASNQVCTVVIAGSGWANGAAHTVKIVASDGTPVAYSVHS